MPQLSPWNLMVDLASLLGCTATCATVAYWFIRRRTRAGRTN